MNRKIIGLPVILTFVLLSGCGLTKIQESSDTETVSIARRGESLIGFSSTTIELKTVTQMPSPESTHFIDNPSIPTLTKIATSTATPTSTEEFEATEVIELDPVSTNNCEPVIDQSFESRVIKLVNDERTKKGLPALTEQSLLTQAARDHSKDMACNRYFSHESEIYGDVIVRVNSIGYQFSAIGENIAAGHDTPEDVVDGWMESTGHRANILNAGFTQVGVGYIYWSGSEYQGYWTLIVGAP